MLEIKVNQELKVNNILSYRGKTKQIELENIVQDMENKIQVFGTKRTGYPIIATFGVEGGFVDVEILLPIDNAVENVDKYTFKSKLQIVNAVVASYKGHPACLQDACNKLNQYIINNKLQPITAGYNVTKYTSTINLESTEIDVYVISKIVK